VRVNATKRRSAAGGVRGGLREKNAEIQGQTIAFVDERGLSERPHRCRTRAPRGHTPAYAPEVNPAEYIWGHLKQHALPNLCPTNLWDLSVQARRALRRMRRRPTLVRAFWIQAGLFD